MDSVEAQDLGEACVRQGQEQVGSVWMALATGGGAHMCLWLLRPFLSMPDTDLTRQHAPPFASRWTRHEGSLRTFR